MADRRMFTKKITESDAFLDMPPSTQMLYFHLSMNADDDGFVNNPKKIQKMCDAKDDDLRVLLAKSFIIAFDSGIIVIKHWRMHNYIQADRYKPTDYVEEKKMLSLKPNNAYTLNNSESVYKLDTECIQSGYTGKDSIDKNSIDKDSIGEDTKPNKHRYGQYKNVLLTDEEMNRLFEQFGEDTATRLIDYLDEAIEMKGYKYKSHYLVIAKKDSWVQENVLKRNRNTGIDWENA